MVMVVMDLLAGDALSVKGDALVRVVVGVVDMVGHFGYVVRFEQDIRRIMFR